MALLGHKITKNTMTHIETMHGTADYNYCPHCGSEAVFVAQNGQQVLTCECGYVHYKDPKVAAGVLIKDKRNRILLMKRAHNPRKGYWSYPSGYVDFEEKVETAAIREVKEEVGVEVGIDKLIGVYSEEGNRVVLIVYEGTIIKGTPSPGEESEEVAYFELKDLPEMAFPRDLDIISRWIQNR
jgi:ADP-ribose pyrophosphatase YjhB (NUDIX family)